jgi:hypothetical protein
MLRVQRSRGAFSGVLLVLLGLWGGLIPFVGPYVHYAYTPDRAWVYTSGRFWLELLPAAGTVLGGLILLASRLRPAALFGAWVAAVSGCWFAIGGALAPLWTGRLDVAGTPVGGPVARAVEQIGFFAGLGVVIVFVATLALGRLSVVAVRDLKAAAPVAATAEPAAATAVAGQRTARWPGRASTGTEPAQTQSTQTRPGRTRPGQTQPAEGTQSRPTSARTVLTKVFPSRTSREDAGQAATAGQRTGRHSADSGDTSDGGQAEVSSGASQR